MIDDLAVRWYEAERKFPTEPRWGELPVRRQDEIRKRVKLVLEGEVRKSECSPGDLAVWFGRFRDLKAPEKLEPISYWRHRVFYDSLDIAGPPGPRQRQVTYETQENTHLFGNYNIGNRAKSNMQCAGTLAFSEPFHITRTWISVPTEDELVGGWDNVLGQMVITYVMGDRPQLQLPARELWSDPRPTRIDVPVRQTFSVEVGFYGKALRQLKDAVRGRDPEREPVRLYVFLEGWQHQVIM